MLQFDNTFVVIEAEYYELDEKEKKRENRYTAVTWKFSLT